MIDMFGYCYTILNGTTYIQHSNLSINRRVTILAKVKTKQCDECPLKDKITWDSPLEETSDILCVYNPLRPVLIQDTDKKLKACGLLARWRRRSELKAMAEIEF